MTPESNLGARRDRLIHEHIHDPYKTPRKLLEPTVCPECGAIFHEGRWQWLPAPANAHRTLCQACHRIRDNYPAGLIVLRGSFVHDHKAEMIRLARHHESAEKQAHPLHRIMQIDEQPDSVSIKTTDLHLPHRIGNAIKHAYQGDLKIRYDEEGYFVRVEWLRET